jgi:hypothetical protein
MNFFRGVAENTRKGRCVVRLPDFGNAEIPVPLHKTTLVAGTNVSADIRPEHFNDRVRPVSTSPSTYWNIWVARPSPIRQRLAVRWERPTDLLTCEPEQGPCREFVCDQRMAANPLDGSMDCGGTELSAGCQNNVARSVECIKVN